MEEVKLDFEEVTEDKLHSLLSHIEIENGRESFTIDPIDPNGSNKATLTMKDIWPKGVNWSVKLLVHKKTFREMLDSFYSQRCKDNLSKFLLQWYMSSLCPQEESVFL